MSEEDKDLKNGDKTLEGSGQPEKKENTDASQKEEKVEISKSELEQIKRDRDNYREGLLANKRKGRTLPGSDINSEKSKKEEDGDGSEEEFITKKEFQATQKAQAQKTAIAELQKNPEIDEHWDEIMEYYSPRPGEANTIEGIISAGNRAFKGWKADHPTAKTPEKKEEGEDKKVISDIASDKGIGSGKDKPQQQEKKTILNKGSTPIGEWYGK